MKMLRIFVLFILLMLCLTGCAHKRELNYLGIASSLSIDKVGERYLVGCQLINPDGVRAKQSFHNSPVFTYKSEGSTLNEAIDGIDHQMPRSLFLAHLRFVVLGEKTAREDLSLVFDYLLRHPRVRSDLIFLVSKEKSALDILYQLTPIEEIPAESLYQNISSHVGGNLIYRDHTLNKLVRDMEVKDIFLPGVTVSHHGASNPEKDSSKGDIPSTITVSNTALFRDNHFVGWANNVEDRSILYLLSSSSKSDLSVKIPECQSNMSILVRNPHATISGEIVAGKPKVTIKVRAISYLSGSHCKISDSRTKVAEIEHQINEEMKKTIKAGVQSILRKYQIDIFGFGWTLERDNPKEWKKIAPQWRQWLGNLDVQVNVKTTLEGTGQIFDPIKPPKEGIR